MKCYVVVSRRDYTEIFDNYANDFIYAENEDAAIETYKMMLIENGCDAEDLEEMEFRVKEYERV